jgi:molybdate transport system substrate-binding protein
VTERLSEAFKRDTGHDVAAAFGAVGAMKARVTSGETVDVIVLTQAMIDELAGGGFIERGSRVDLGTVGTGVAVRAGTPVPDVSSAEALRGVIVGASTIVCPDPAIATAGKVVMALMEKLGVLEEIKDRMRFFPNGYAAMGWLAASEGRREVGSTQVTEILPNKGVSYAGPLPEAFQMKTVYSAGIAQRAAERALAKDFIARYAALSARALLAQAGYEL